MYSRRKKICYFTASKRENVVYTDLYNDVKLLEKFISMDNGKIVASRITGTKSRYQRILSKSIKLARYLALLPYCDRH